jgi:hypothetical protein
VIAEIADRGTTLALGFPLVASFGWARLPGAESPLSHSLLTAGDALDSAGIRIGDAADEIPSTFRFVFALPTNERLEAMREPQVVPTTSEQTNQAPKGGL